MSKQLCIVCNDIFSGKQRLNQEQPHHRTATGFLEASKEGCYICRTITSSSEWERLGSEDGLNAAWHLSYPADCPDGFYRLTIDTISEVEEGSVTGVQNDGEDIDEDKYKDEDEEDEEGNKYDDARDPENDVDSSHGENRALAAAWAFHIQSVAGKWWNDEK